MTALDLEALRGIETRLQAYILPRVTRPEKFDINVRHRWAEEAEIASAQLAALKAATARIEELEGALKPFAEAADNAAPLGHPSGTVLGSYGINYEHLSRARAAFHPSDGEGHGSVGPSRNQGEG